MVDGTSVLEELWITMFKRLSLWTAVGNGAGLLGAGSKLDEMGDLAAVLLPACWGFPIGLAGSVLLTGCLFLDFVHQKNVSVGTAPDISRKWMQVWLNLLIALSALGFLFGVFYPLWTLSTTYFAWAS